MYQRKEKWYSDFWHEGKRHTKSWGAISKTVATEKAKRITFEKFSEKYLEYARLNKKPSSARRNETSINMLMPFFKGRLIESITPFMVEKYKKARREKGKEPATVNRDVATLRNMMNKAVEWGYLSANPMSTVKQFREDNEVMWVLSKEEEDALLAAAKTLTAKSQHMEAMIKCALHTGMRQAEIFNMKKGDVHLKERYIFIPETIDKTHSSRNVPINDTLAEVLKDTLSKSNGSSKYVFTNHKGETYKDIKNGFWKIVKEYGLERIEMRNGKAKKVRFRFHDCRHTFGSRLGMEGVDLKTIMDIMGHKTYKVAMRYQHPTPEHKLEAVKNLDEVPSIFTTGVKTGVLQFPASG